MRRLSVLFTALAVATFVVEVLPAQAPPDTPGRVFEVFSDLAAPVPGTRWPDVSRGAREQRRRSWQGLLVRTRALASAQVSADDRLSLGIIERDLIGRLEGEPFDVYMSPLSAFVNGFHNNIIDTVAALPARTTTDYEAIVARLEDVPRYVDQQIDALSQGLEAGYSQSRRTTSLVAQQLRAQSDSSADATRLLAAFRSFPPSISATDQERLRRRGESAYRSGFVPSWRKLYTFLTTTYMAVAREDGGLSQLRDGARVYELLVRRTTSTTLTPREIHDIGLKEIERIETEMLAIARAKGFTGTLQDYDASLLATPGQVFRSTEEMLAFARDVAMTVAPELPRVFGRLPKTPFGIRAVAADREEAASNSYSVAPLDGTRAGWVNLRTYQPETYTRGDTRSTTLHEGVPGHHLHLAIQREQVGVPGFRRTYGLIAFSEGWALYAESLANDMGLFQDPDSRYGRLAGERFRAARLVVDTGMHALAWSRERALDYFKLHAAQSRWVEIDRYLENPSQALGYKIGELTFKQLRVDAERALGSRFDLRAFHDVVLGNGTLPFDLLREQVNQYVAKVAQGN